MKSVAVVYVKYSLDVMRMNNYRYDIDIEGVFSNLLQALKYTTTECDNQILGNEDWYYYKQSSDMGIIKFDVYYDNEWQYSYYIKEMGVK